MICKKYDNLSHVDKIKYVGELVHIVQSNDDFFEMGEELIAKAKAKGLLDGVVILPEIDNQKNETK